MFLRLLKFFLFMFRINFGYKRDRYLCNLVLKDECSTRIFILGNAQVYNKLFANDNYLFFGSWSWGSTS